MNEEEKGALKILGFYVSTVGLTCMAAFMSIGGPFAFLAGLVVGHYSFKYFMIKSMT